FAEQLFEQANEAANPANRVRPAGRIAKQLVEEETQDKWQQLDHALLLNISFPGSAWERGSRGSVSRKRQRQVRRPTVAGLCEAGRGRRPRLQNGQRTATTSARQSLANCVPRRSLGTRANSLITPYFSRLHLKARMTGSRSQ